MNSNRLWLIGTAIVVIAVFALGWFVGIQPLLATTATAISNAEAVDAINAQEQATLLQLKEEYEEIDDIRDQVDEAELSIPTRAKLSTFILQVNSLAAATGVIVSNITTGDGILYVLPEGAAILDEEGQPIPAPAAPENLVFVPMNIKVSGPYASVLAFIKGLQSGDRLFMATQVAVAAEAAAAPDPKSKEPVVAIFGGEITGQIYVLFDPEAPDIDLEVDGDAEVEPTPEVSPSPSSSSSPSASPAA